MLRARVVGINFWRGDPLSRGAKPPPVPTRTFWSISMAELSVLIALEKFPALEPHRGLDPARRSALDPNSYMSSLLTWSHPWPFPMPFSPTSSVGLLPCSKLGTGLSIFARSGPHAPCKIKLRVFGPHPTEVTVGTLCDLTGRWVLFQACHCTL